MIFIFKVWGTITTRECTQLVTPDPEMMVTWNNTQKGMQSVIEVSIGMVKLFHLAAEKVRLNPELHELCLLICYQLTNVIFKEFPLRIP